MDKLESHRYYFHYCWNNYSYLFINCLSNCLFISQQKYNKNVLVYIFLLPMWINFVIAQSTLRLCKWLNCAGNITATHPIIAIIIGMVYDYLPFAILPLYNQMLKNG